MMRAASLATLLLFLGSSARADDAFWALGHLPFNTGPVFSEAYAVSRDGSVVVGRSIFRNSETGAFRWDETRGIELLGDFPGGNFSSRAWAVSENGTKIVGAATIFTHVAGAKAFRWDPVGGFRGLTEDDVGTTAYGISGNGWVVPVNVDDEVPTIWTEGGGFETLPLPSGATTGQARTANRNGLVVIGSSDLPGSAGWIWGPGGTVSVPLPAGAESGYLTQISPDGSIVVGTVSSPGGTYEPYLFVEGQPAMGLGAPTAGGYVSASGMSDDASIVVGNVGPTYDEEPYVWREGVGWRHLEVELTLAGVMPVGWDLESVNAVSGDGTTFVGEGVNPDGDREAFAASIGEPIPIVDAVPLPGSFRGLLVVALAAGAALRLRRRARLAV